MVGGPKNIIEFAAIFVCLLLSWSRWYLMKWSSNSDSRIFNNSWPLHLNFSNVINLCPNIWFIKNSKCQQSFFEKRSRQKKNTNLSYFKGPLFCNGWPYWYESQRVLRDFCGLSKKYRFATFPRNIAKVMSIWVSKVGHTAHF